MTFGNRRSCVLSDGSSAERQTGRVSNGARRGYRRLRAAAHRPSRSSRRDALVIANQDLVEKVSRDLGRFARSASLDRDDLIGEGQIALISAADRYDPDRGSFRGYALRRIKGAMLDAIRRDNFLSRHARGLGHRVVVVSFDKPVGDGITLSDTLCDSRASVEEIVEHRDLIARLLSADEPLRYRTELTPPELEALRGAALGETAEQTAARLSKSIDTIRSQRKTALKRLGAKSIAHAVFIAHDEIAA
jgi:RNA polymerase sigma factor (sigma-70 family)